MTLPLETSSGVQALAEAIVSDAALGSSEEPSSGPDYAGLVGELREGLLAIKSILTRRYPNLGGG